MPDAPPPPPPPQASGPPSVPQRNVVMLILAYLGILALIPFLTEKTDPEVQWHAKHGLVFLAFEIVIWLGILFTGFILHFLWALYPLYGLGIIVLHVMAISKAMNGQRLIIPGVSEYASKF